MVCAVRNVILCFSYQSILLPLFSFFNAGMSFGECYRAKEPHRKTFAYVIITLFLAAGLVISSLCGNENTASQVSSAAFYPALALSGMFCLERVERV